MCEFWLDFDDLVNIVLVVIIFAKRNFSFSRTTKLDSCFNGVFLYNGKINFYYLNFKLIKHKWMVVFLPSIFIFFVSLAYLVTGKQKFADFSYLICFGFSICELGFSVFSSLCRFDV